MHLRCLLFLFFPLLVKSQITHRDLIEKKYSSADLQRYLVKSNSFRPYPQTSNEWKNILPDSIIDFLIGKGENALKQNFPNIPATVTLDFLRNGNRTRYENISFNKRNLLWDLVLAETVERKKRFLDAIVNDIWSICEESFWGSSAHLFIQKAGKGLPDVEEPVVDLFAAETAANLALADYFVGPQLDSMSPLIRKRIYYEVNRRIFVPLQNAKYEWLGKEDKNAKLNNWAPWIMSNYLTAVLFLERDAKKKEKYVQKAIQITDQYINGIGDDGATEEGPHYWSFGAGCVFDILNLLQLASNDHINIYNEKLIQKMGDYIYDVHIAGDYFVNVADSHPEEFPEPILVWRYGRATNDSSLAGFGAWLFQRRDIHGTISQMFHRARSLFDMMNIQKISGANRSFIEGDRWLPNVQMMTARLGNGFFISAHGGNNGESHNHNDVGDFIVYYKGDPVIVDVGSGTYTAKTFSADRYKLWFNSSSYHNLPTINGLQQSDGSQYAAIKVLYKKTDKETSMAVNLDKTFPSNSGLINWKRTFISTDGAITILDSFLTKNSVSITQSFMTVCSTDISQPGKIILTTQHGNKVELRYDTQWKISKEIIPLITEEDQGLKATWHDQPITRILLIHQQTLAKGNFEYQITELK